MSFSQLFLKLLGRLQEKSSYPVRLLFERSTIAQEKRLHKASLAFGIFLIKPSKRIFFPQHEPVNPDFRQFMKKMTEISNFFNSQCYR